MGWIVGDEWKRDLRLYVADAGGVLLKNFINFIFCGKKIDICPGEGILGEGKIFLAY